MNIKIHALIVIALLFIIWILGVVALASKSWLQYNFNLLGYSVSASYGLSAATACISGTCSSVGYSDLTVNSTDISRLKASGNILFVRDCNRKGAMGYIFGLGNIFSIMLIGLFFLLDAVYDIKVIGSKVPKIFESKTSWKATIVFALPHWFYFIEHVTNKLAMQILAIIFYCAIFPFDSVNVDLAAGTGLILLAISIVLTAVAIVAYFIVGKFIIGEKAVITPTPS